MTPGFFSFTIVDGLPTMRDSLIGRIWQQIIADDARDIMFMEGDITNEQQFIAMVKSPATHFVGVYDRETELFNDPDTFPFSAVFWINRFEHRRAACHFIVFKAARENSVKIGKASLTYCFDLRHPSGVRLQLLWGIVAASNIPAIQYAQRCGGIAAAIIPQYIWNEIKQCCEDAVLIHYARDRHENLQ